MPYFEIQWITARQQREGQSCNKEINNDRACRGFQTAAILFRNILRERRPRALRACALLFRLRHQLPQPLTLRRASSGLPSSSNSSTLSVSPSSARDRTCKSPECRPENAAHDLLTRPRLISVSLF